MRGSPDVNQKAALQAVREQAAHCLALLDTIAAANARIMEKIEAGDPLWARLVAERYNKACRDRTAAPDGAPAADAYRAAIGSDPDLKAVCDSRWLLGEALDELHARQERLDTIAAPYDDFERRIRQSVTGLDRSPAELAEGVSASAALGRAAAAWTPDAGSDGTLVDRWTNALKNNPLTAAIIVAGTVVTAAAGVYTALPESVTRSVGQLIRPATPVTEGWAIGGTIDPADTHRWSRANVDIIEQSGGSGRPYPVRQGDIVEPRVPLPVWITDFAAHRNAKLLTPPGAAQLGAPEANRTGAVYAAGARFEVAAVSVMHIHGQDDTLWLRLIPR